MTAVYRSLAPTERFGSQIKLLVSCFFAVTVINAVSGAVGLTDITDILHSDTSYNDYSVQLDKLTAEETAANMKRIIKDELAKEGIVPEKIYADVNISDNGGISISEIRLVFGVKEYSLYADRAVALTRRLTGAKITVTAGTKTGAVRDKKEREDQ